MNIIEAKNLTKIYNPYSSNPKIVLKGLDIVVKDGEFICIMGASGSGKSTLINILSSIDNATSGIVMIDKADLFLMNENDKSNIRKSKIGFIFQNYSLIQSLSIRDNILFPMRLNRIGKEKQLKVLKNITDRLGIQEILDKYPFECSGGQQQRVAIARALIMEPKILFADEPTGNLDSKNAKEIMELFVKINKENKTTIIMVSHDSLIASYAMKMFYMQDGTIIDCITRSDLTQVDYYHKIIRRTSNVEW